MSNEVIKIHITGNVNSDTWPKSVSLDTYINVPASEVTGLLENSNSPTVTLQGKARRLSHKEATELYGSGKVYESSELGKSAKRVVVREYTPLEVFVENFKRGFMTVAQVVEMATKFNESQPPESQIDLGDLQLELDNLV